MAKGTSFAFAVLVQLIAVALILLCVFAPAYHRQRITLPGGTSMELALSLTKAVATGQCTSAWTNYKVFRRRSWPMCERLTLALNGKSLREVSALLCGTEFLLFNLPDTGCSNMTAIENASFVYLIFLAFAFGGTLLALLLTVLYFTTSPYLPTRSAVIGAGIFVATMHLIGFAVYLAVGGELHPAMFLGRLLLLPGVDRQDERSFGFTSYAAGVGISAVSVIWACLLPVYAHIQLKRRYSEEESVASLEKLHNLDQESPLYTF